MPEETDSSNYAIISIGLNIFHTPQCTECTSPWSVCYHASGDELIFLNFHLFHKKYCKISLVHCFHTFVLQTSPFSTYSISTPSAHSRIEAMSEEEARWRVKKKDQSAGRYWHGLLLTKQQHQWMKNVLLPPPHHMPLTQANSQLCSAELFPTVEHSNEKAQPYTVSHLFQSSATLATVTQLFSFGNRKAHMTLYNALFREVIFPKEGNIPCSDFAQINNGSFSNYFPDFWYGDVLPNNKQE